MSAGDRPALTVRHAVNDIDSARAALEDLASQSAGLLVYRGLFLTEAKAAAMNPPPQTLDWWVVLGTADAITLYIQIDPAAAVAAGSQRRRLKLTGTLVQQ